MKGLKLVLFMLLFPGMLMVMGASTGLAGLGCCGLPEVTAGEAVVPAFISVSPTGLSAGSGEVHTVYVTVLDGERRPIPNALVTASSDTPNRASVEPAEARTDANGKAVFTVKGVAYFSGSRAIITFKAGDAVATVETAQQFL